MQDWNVFFSSIAQTSASLIGVIIAFIISRILNESTEHDQLLKEKDYLRIEINKILISCNDLNFAWHDKMLLNNDSDIQDAINTGQFDNLIDDELIYEMRNFDERIYKPRDVVGVFKEKIERKKEKDRIKATRSSFFPLIDVEPLGIVGHNTWPNIRKFERDFSDLEVDANIIIDKLRIHKTSITKNIQDFNRLKRIMITFLPIIVLTIIYPLHFLPLSEGEQPEITMDLLNMIDILISVKGMFLISLVIIAMLMVIYFCSICSIHIKSYIHIQSELPNRYLEIVTYCSEFKEKKAI